MNGGSIIIFSLVTISIAATVAKHEPQVHENLDEDMPKYIRTPRHSDGSLKNYQPSVFDYRMALQQDRLKSKYHKQQQVDSRTLKILPINHDAIFGLQQQIGHERGSVMSRPVEDDDNGWKPFQPQFMNMVRPKLRTQPTPSDMVRKDKHENDLDAEGSETKEKSAENDKHSEYVYVSPSILKNNFGLDSQTVQQILQNSSPNVEEIDANKYQISELQDLLGKNPALQLQGLQKLLDDANPLTENKLANPTEKEVGSIQIDHNGSSALPTGIPELETLQQQIDAVNKAQEQQVLAAAQAQAEAHVKAQHEAIALAQKKAQEEAFAKIAAHNQGISPLHTSDPLVIQEGGNQMTPAPLISDTVGAVDEIVQNSLESNEPQEASPKIAALHEHSLEQVVVHPHGEYTGNFEKSNQDLRNVRPRIQGVRGRFYRPETAKYQYLSTDSPLYNTKEVQNYSPVSPYTPHLIAQNDPLHKPTLQEHREETQLRPLPSSAIELPSAGEKQLYSEEQHDDVSKVRFRRSVQNKKHINFSFNGSKVVATDLDEYINQISGTTEGANYWFDSSKSTTRGFQDYNEQSEDKSYLMSNSRGIVAALDQSNAHIRRASETNIEQVKKFNGSHKYCTNYKENGSGKHQSRRKNSQSTNNISAVSQIHETTVNPGLELYKQTQKALDSHSDASKNVIIINNSNNNEGAKNENHLSAPQTQNINHDLVFSHNFTIPVPEKKVVRYEHPNFKKIVHKVLRAEAKVQRVLSKIG